MGVRLRDVLGHQLNEFRYEPTDKRVRAQLAGQTVIDSDRAILVWEPRRVVPTYAVPEEEVKAELTLPVRKTAQTADFPEGFQLPDLTAAPVLDPRIPFGVRSTPGQPVEIHNGGRIVAGFRPADPAVSGYVIVDFAGFDRWLEEDDEIVGHPRDPFHRIDVRSSSRHVRVKLGGEILADTNRALMLFETMLPSRYYIPRNDVLATLEPSRTTTYCAYKGEASYWSVRLGARVIADLAWGYENPLLDALPVQGCVAFFDEKTDLEVDGTPRPRPVTPWS